MISTGTVMDRGGVCSGRGISSISSRVCTLGKTWTFSSSLTAKLGASHQTSHRAKGCSAPRRLPRRRGRGWYGYGSGLSALVGCAQGQQNMLAAGGLLRHGYGGALDGQLGPGGIDMGHDGSDKFQVARLLFDLLYAGEACGVPARPGRNPG